MYFGLAVCSKRVHSPAVRRCRDRPAGSLARAAVGDGGDGVDCGEAVTAVPTWPRPAPVHGPGVPVSRDDLMSYGTQDPSG